MALDKSNITDKKVTNIADARKERLDKSNIAYGRRSGDDPIGPNKQAIAEASSEQPSVRSVPTGRTTGRRFDKEKVEKIKAQLARGEYKIDSLRVADFFIEHERHT